MHVCTTLDEILEGTVSKQNGDSEKISAVYGNISDSENKMLVTFKKILLTIL